jgi:signal transduction histidine kinase/ActR/RegA family two-component response regulator
MRSFQCPGDGLAGVVDAARRRVAVLPVLATGGLIAALAAVVLGGWVWGTPAPSAVPGWRVMVPSTAFGFVCLGLGLMAFASGHQRLPIAAACAAAVLPVATLVEYAVDVRWGVESWLGVPFPRSSPVAGRMSPMTALSVTLVAIGLAALPVANRWGDAAVRVGAGTALALSWLAVLALSFDTTRLANAPLFPGMAVLTVGLLALSSVAVLASSTHAMARLRDAHLHAAVAPRTLLLAFGLPLLLGQLRTVLALVLPAGIAATLVVAVFAMVLAAVVWRVLARLQAFQTQQERLMLELEARVDERTRALALANEQLHDSEGQLREADRRKDEFLATLAHELRNPLAPIRTGLEILKSDAVSVEAAAQAHRVIGRQMRHLVRLIDDLLDVSRITANKLDLRLEHVSVTEILHQSVETSRADLDRARHTLTLHLPAEPAAVFGDPTRLTQIVSNLLQNACKYTPRGGHIVLGASSHDGQVEITVRDNGIGIAPADVPRLFEKFSQVIPGLQRGGGGLGLGLALVRGLVSLHGGVVEVHSAGLGHGSEFVVRLARVEHVPEAAEPSQLTVTAGPTRRVLVVDDNVDNADSLALYLRQRGHLVDTAYDGDVACRAAERFRPNVVLLDIGLPKLGGHEVCRYIRRQPWGVDMQIIAQTGWGQDTDRLRSRDAGFDAHLVKPIAPAELLALIARDRA